MPPRPHRLPSLLPHLISHSRKYNGIQDMHVSRLCTLSSADFVPDHPILVRDFIQAALYHPLHGYFSTRPEAVGVLKEPLSFASMKGRRDYMQHLDLLYKQNDVSWFTPVELFKPWYGYALAEYILRSHNSEVPLQIFEIGGGAGTCARNILDYIEMKAPSIYKTMRYVSIEISNALANIQAESVHAVRSHKSHFFVECRNACNRSEWGEVDDCPCFVIMLEVLDNQPHDLIFKKNFRSPWMETYVTRSKSAAFREVHQSVQDPLILRCIEILEGGSPKIKLKNLFSGLFRLQKKAWIPTGCLQLLEALYSAHPSMALIAADFRILPDVKIEGERAPLVASKKDGVTRDHSTYLDVQGGADIFFPTDFHMLRKLDHHCYSNSSFPVEDGSMHRKRNSRIVTSSEFMKRYADISKTRTSDGFNPLLDDYSNSSFYLSRLT